MGMTGLPPGEFSLIYLVQKTPVRSDEGVLVKEGADVLVSVRHAIGGTDLSKLHEAVKREFLNLDERERDVRTAVSKLESSFVGRYAEFQRER